jgi:hypothetical protein
MTRLSAWLRSLVADDPAPELSRLDRLDGLTDAWETVTFRGWTSQVEGEPS